LDADIAKGVGRPGSYAAYRLGRPRLSLHWLV
jgi:hypothetical protein